MKKLFFTCFHIADLIVNRSYAFSTQTLIILRKCSRDASPENTYWILKEYIANSRIPLDILFLIDSRGFEVDKKDSNDLFVI